MLQISDTFLAMPIIVHEFVQHAVPEEELSNPQNLDQRSCLYIQRIPPDQLNPEVRPSLEALSGFMCTYATFRPALGKQCW